MKTLFVFLAMFALLMTTGCGDSSPSMQSEKEIASSDQQFTVSAPWSVNVKQGEIKSTVITLNRGSYFKQEVTLTLKSDGINMIPSKVVVKADQPPEIPIQVEAPKDAATGAYRVSITGTPERGAPALAEFTVNVSAP